EREEQPVAVRQQLRAMRRLSLPYGDEACWLASARRHLPDAVRTLAVPDHSIGVPPHAPRVLRVAERDSGSTSDRHSHQLTLAVKRDPLAVRRKERLARIFGALDGDRTVQTVQALQVQLVVRPVHEMRSLGRYRNDVPADARPPRRDAGRG